ncbi:CU044_2847 family protein [Streptomyces massasporeus]|uniref:CU044_2847 family protein n=1 Tax=Streptomyces massasporeus TaxID=67324 RepID=UPI0033C35ABF
MAEYVEIRLGEGESVPFEIADLDAPVPAGRRWRATGERLQETFEHGVDRVLRVAQLVAERARSGPGRPERVTVEIGVNVTTDAGVVVARATSAAHLTVSVEWAVGDAAAPDPTDAVASGYSLHRSDDSDPVSASAAATATAVPPGPAANPPPDALRGDAVR